MYICFKIDANITFHDSYENIKMFFKFLNVFLKWKCRISPFRVKYRFEGKCCHRLLYMRDRKCIKCAVLSFCVCKRSQLFHDLHRDIEHLPWDWVIFDNQHEYSTSTIPLFLAKFLIYPRLQNAFEEWKLIIIMRKEMQLYY